MHKEIALTPEGQTQLEEELHHLETVRRREVGERIKEAKEFGDISENSEYDDAKNEQAWVESRIAEINLILAHATIIESPSKSDKVCLGCKVELKDAESGDVHVYQIVGSAEADPAHDRISQRVARRAGDHGQEEGRHRQGEHTLRSCDRVHGHQDHPSLAP